MSGRLALLLVGTAMAVLMVAVAGMALAADYQPEDPDCQEIEEPPPPPPGTPTVAKATPADGATGIDRDANIKAKFSEAMMKDSIKAKTFRIFFGNYSYADLNCETGGPEQDTAYKVRYDAQKKTATLDPAVRLSRRTTYTVWVEGAGDPGRLAVKDRAGNEMASDHIWHFKTGRR